MRRGVDGAHEAWHLRNEHSLVIASLATGHLLSAKRSSMNTPPMLIGAVLLFWGWQAEFPWLGALLAALLESPRWLLARWEFAQADLDRIWNLCVLLFFGAFVVAFVSNDGLNTVNTLTGNSNVASRMAAVNKSARSVILVLLWLPLTFLPIVVAQAFSHRGRMDWSTFSWWLRRQRKAGSQPDGFKASSETSAPSSGLNVAWPYFALCVLATSAANQKSIWFSVGLAALLGWALWAMRPRSFSVTSWAACLVAVIGLGFAAQVGMRSLQQLMRQLDSAIVARFANSGRGFEPKESRTAIGSLGRLKLSGSIVLRVEAEGTPPSLLREASYKLFRSPYWAAPKQDFFALTSEGDLSTWRLLTNKPVRKAVTVSTFLSGGQGLLAVPHGVATLEELLADQLGTNKLGVLNVTEGPGFVRYRALYDEGESIDTLPDSDDRDVPANERALIARVAEELGLANMTPEQALKAVAGYFARNFSYTTWLGERRWRRSNDTPLAEFLLKTRTGHCEYFATATVLLLRAAGVPTRYAVGYSVQEKKGDEWVVRERHAHAWCLAWVDGAWRDVDNTPGSWSAMEATRASAWERISDAWSKAWFGFSKWRWGKGEWRRYLIWVLVPLIGLAAWRLMSQKQWSRAGPKTSTRVGAVKRLGLDSEFYLIERRLIELGLERRDGETLSAWLTRISRESARDMADTRPLLTLHYQLRFDPAGLAPDERERLKKESALWVGRMESQSRTR